MSNSQISVTEGTGKNIGSYQISEDAVTKQIQRSALNEADGSDVGLSVKLGGVTETAPATDTASSGLNGRLQRVAQRITSLIALIPAALTASGNFKVAVVEQTASAIVAGDVANDGADTGNPIKTGGVARTTNPTAVADADRVNRMHDKVGRTVTATEQVRQLVADQNTTISGSTSETTIVTAVASTFNDLVCLIIANTSGTAVRVDIRDVTAGSVRASIYCPAGATTGFVPKIPLAQATVNTAWTAQSSGSVTDLRIFAQVIKNI